MSIVMGLDQHRAQITAEWIDTSTGEVSRARVAPADRAGGAPVPCAVRAARSSRSRWRRRPAGGSWSRSCERVGAEVHLAEPAETSALKGNKKRAKTDRADARHLRELLMVGRLPESWIPPAHILDLRARVRLRHTLSQQRGEWQQRIQAVLYHHGCPQRGDLMTARRPRVARRSAAAGVTAREQVTVALAMIDALDAPARAARQGAARATPAGSPAARR